MTTRVQGTVASVLIAVWVRGLGRPGPLGYRRELEAIPDTAARQRRYDELVAEAYDDGKAINAVTWLDIDAVIDPADTRKWSAMFLHK